MAKEKDDPHISLPTAMGIKPQLEARKIGFVSRNYNQRYANGKRDFSYMFGDVLSLLDKQNCDTVFFFSLFTLEPRADFSPIEALTSLRNIQAVMVEEFTDGRQRRGGRFVVYYRLGGQWREYSFNQYFGSLRDLYDDQVEEFVKLELPHRIMGNVCVLLCGESNGVYYSPKYQEVQDTYGLRRKLQDVQIVLNPVHDRMTRHEMEKKRLFLSKPNRLLVSVWNKGKLFKNHLTGVRKPRKEPDPAWSVFRSGKREVVDQHHTDHDVEIGVVMVR